MEVVVTVETHMHGNLLGKVLAFAHVNITRFCPTHTGSQTEDPSVIIPKDIKRVTICVLRTLIARTILYLPTRIPNESQPQDSTIIVAIVNWLRFLGSHGDALLHLIRQEFISSPLTVQPVEILLHSCLSLAEEPLDETLFLFLDLLQDPDFKERFIRYYIKIYPALIEHMIKTNGEVNVVYKISPQLFSIPAVTLPLAREKGGLMDMILIHLYKLFEQVSHPDPRTGLKLVDCDNAFISPHNYYAFTNDLNTLLGSTQIARLLVAERTDLFKLLLNLLALLQGVDPNTRRTDTYVEYESEIWKSAFSLEVELSRSILGVVEGFKIELTDKPNDMPNEQFASLSQLKIQKIFQIICDSLAVCLFAQKLPMVEVNNYEIAAYTVSTQPVSFHLPLHRTLGRFIHVAVKLYPEIPLHSLLSAMPVAREFLTLLIEDPLHIQVLLAQTKAGIIYHCTTAYSIRYVDTKRILNYKSSLPISWKLLYGSLSLRCPVAASWNYTLRS
jgi:hypothetical protein